MVSAAHVRRKLPAFKMERARGPRPADRARNGCAANAKQTLLASDLAGDAADRASQPDEREAFVTAPFRAARALTFASKKITRSGEVHCCAT
jgi:hypothetical protein